MKGPILRRPRRLITQSMDTLPSCQNAVHLPFSPQDGILTVHSLKRDATSLTGTLIKKKKVF